MLDYNKIIDDISKMDKKELLNRYWLDDLKTSQYMIDYFLDKFYELELKNIKAFYDKQKNEIKINDDYILYPYDRKYDDDFIMFFQWLIYWLYNI